MIRARAQQELILAEELVSEVERERDEVRRIYGGLCHSFPALVRTCGLCQALAFSKDKATVSDGQEPSYRSKAHSLLIRHVGRVLAVSDDDPLKAVRDADVVEYMLHTRRVLSAWVYFKRFAVSILRVANAGVGEVDR
jgi:CRISPR-associated protein Cmr5